MRVCGVICEYNPFHRGHALHLSRARTLSGADYVVCAMSGPFAQRGTPARHDKWTRARMALLGGADLVLELPTRFACAPAPDFAAGGVSLLSSLGVVTHLSFGCEENALPLLEKTSDLFRREPPAFTDALRCGLDRGLPYPRARALAAEQVLDIPGLADTLASPNAVLALEYLQALPEGMVAVPVMREGSGYHDAHLSALSSATAIRHALENNNLSDALAAVPFPELLREAEAHGEFHAPEALTQALLFILRTTSRDTLSSLYGMDEGLEARFIEAARTAKTREALLEQIKTRRYTHARLSRLASSALLGITRDFAQAHRTPTYARVLGFRKTAAPLLHAIKQCATIPLVTKTAKYDSADPLFALDLRAQDVWALGCASPACRQAGRDFVTSLVVVT